MSPHKQDLHRSILASYSGRVFRWQKWERLSPDWTHDHCPGCNAAFSDSGHEDVLTEGWVTVFPSEPNQDEHRMIEAAREVGSTLVPSPKPRSYQRDYICPACFERYRDKLNFIVDPDHPQWKLARM